MTNYVYFKKNLLIIYIFMIKIVFNFKCIYVCACVTCFFKIIWLIIYIFIIKFVFNFKYINAFVWVTC